MRRIYVNLILVTAAALALWAAAPTAEADTIYIGLTGLSLTLNGGTIYDSGQSSYSGGSVADATPLGSITVEANSDVLGEYTSNVYADVLIPNVPLVPPFTDNIANTGTSYVDLFSSGGPLLRLQFDAMNVYYINGIDWVAISGSASGVISQNLPGGVTLDPNDEISIYFQCDGFSSLTTDGGGNLTGFVMTPTHGTGEINGLTAVPEPSALVLLLCLAASVAAARFTKKSG